MSKGTDRLMRRFQCAYNLFARNSRERFQKLVNAVIPLQVVDQIAKRNPRTYEHRRPPENFGVAVDDGGYSSHDDSYFILVSLAGETLANRSALALILTEPVFVGAFFLNVILGSNPPNLAVETELHVLARLRGDEQEVTLALPLRRK